MVLQAGSLVDVAYKKLKQMVYFEKNQLRLRQRLAEFECGEDFERRLGCVADVIQGQDPVQAVKFKDWLSEISFELLPKGMIAPESRGSEKGTFVTNLTSGPENRVPKVNYIFDGPIELHLIAVIWLMIEGQEYDRSLSRHCMGSRLHEQVGRSDDHSAYLFRKYHELYAKWRDGGLAKAKDMLANEGRSVYILALDVQEYYYRIQLDWQELRRQIKREWPASPVGKFAFSQEILGGHLLDCIEAISTCYREVIRPFLSISHTLPPEATCQWPESKNWRVHFSCCKKSPGLAKIS